MSFLLPCPGCGPREVSEFTYGGQLHDPAARRPGEPVGNLPGVQRERWYHRLGCRRWLVCERDVTTNSVGDAKWLGPETASPSAS